MVLVLPRRGTSRSRLLRSALLVFRGALLTGAVTAICYWLRFNSASAGLLFLIAVVLQSLDCGFLEAAIVSVLATAALDYFFIEPRFTLNVDDPLDAVTLACLLTVCLVITRIQARSRGRDRELRLQRNTMESLYRVGQELLALAPAAVAGPALLEPFVSIFELSAICLFDAATLECHTSGHSRGDLAGKTRNAFILSEDAVYPDQQIVVRCLRARSAVFGAIGFEGLRNPELTAPALAALAAAALERARAFRSATAAAAHAQAEMLRSAILDALAHEFKTPLATILTAAGGLRATGSMQPQQAELAEMIEVEASRLGDLTSRLLRLARLDREEVKPRLEKIDAAELAEMSAKRYSRIWPDRRIFFRRQGGYSEVRVDPELIGLALSQLLENACRYSEPDALVLIEFAEEEHMAAITVWNDGPPIPAGERDRIFDRFYRGTTAKKVAPGSGLGLFVARKIALAHGGDLSLADSGANGKSVVGFRLTLPISLNEDSHGSWEV
jgi:two-component system sensor histidine kinase KdpD